MKTFYVIEQIHPCFITSPILRMGNALPFELTEEAFSGRVVATVPNGTHAAD